MEKPTIVFRHCAMQCPPNLVHSASLLSEKVIACANKKQMNFLEKIYIDLMQNAMH